VRRLARASTVVHPLPSAIAALAAAAIALVAGATPGLATTLLIGMLGFQCSIGALNDLLDVDRDQRAGRANPIAEGIVPSGLAVGIVLIGGLVGLAVSAANGALVLLTGAAGYGCGLAYDLVMRARSLGWLCLAVALPLLPMWSWLAVTGELPDRWPVLVVTAAVAGPALHLANGLVDMEADRRSRPGALVVRLGPMRSRILLSGLVAIVYTLAWLTLVTSPDIPSASLALAILASAAAMVGLAGSWSADPTRRGIGWLLQAGSLGLLAVAWLMAAG
jgi:4-hydroxybenzoate polyprenyltransferase